MLGQHVKWILGIMLNLLGRRLGCDWTSLLRARKAFQQIQGRYHQESESCTPKGDGKKQNNTIENQWILQQTTTVYNSLKSIVIPNLAWKGLCDYWDGYITSQRRVCTSLWSKNNWRNWMLAFPNTHISLHVATLSHLVLPYTLCRTSGIRLLEVSQLRTFSKPMALQKNLESPGPLSNLTT